MDLTVDSLEAASFAGWSPVRIRGTPAEPLVDWAVIDGPLRDPFFEQSVYRAMQHPFNHVFERTTPLAAFDALDGVFPPAAPAGFVFHMSRSGSTLIAQMLAQLAGAVVLSEPQAVDGMLHLVRTAGWDDDTALRRLRALIGALSRSHGRDARTFVKFHASHVLDLPLIARAFPRTPWIFAFREPRAVLLSQEKNPGTEIIPWTLDPRRAGIEPAALVSMPHGEYRARMLAAFCEAALEHARRGRAEFIDYAQLPDAVFGDVLPFFGVSPTSAETQRMVEAAGIDAKTQAGAFRERDEPKVPAEIEQLAVQWLDPVYAAMRDVRPSSHPEFVEGQIS